MESNVCPICQHRFARPYNLKKHLETVHSVEKPNQKRYECPICHKNFTTNAYIKKHCQIVHCKNQDIISHVPSASVPLASTPVSASASASASVPLTSTSASVPDASTPVLPQTVEKIVEYLKERDEVLKERDEAIKERDEAIQKDILSLKQEIQQIKPSNNVLQVVCIGSNDNYLRMLTESMGDIAPAIEYIKQCALLEVKGDSHSWRKFIK